MSYKYNRELVENARELRKNMTKEEKHLWLDFLKKLPITVNRQKNIENYIVDFFIASKKIAIEMKKHILMKKHIKGKTHTNEKTYKRKKHIKGKNI